MFEDYWTFSGEDVADSAMKGAAEEDECETLLPRMARELETVPVKSATDDSCVGSDGPGSAVEHRFSRAEALRRSSS